jgi:hypothetical protein
VLEAGHQLDAAVGEEGRLDVVLDALAGAARVGVLEVAVVDVDLAGVEALGVAVVDAAGDAEVAAEAVDGAVGARFLSRPSNHTPGVHQRVTWCSTRASTWICGVRVEGVTQKFT